MLSLIRKMVTVMVTVIAIGIFSQAYADANMYCLNPDDFFESLRVPSWDHGPDKSWLERDHVGYELAGRLALTGEFQHQGDPKSSNFVLKARRDRKMVDFEPAGSAKDYCAALVKICTDIGGPEYRFIGAIDENVRPAPESLLDIRNLNGIAIKKGNELYQCPNWRVYKSEYKKEGFGDSAKYFYDVTCTSTMESQRFTLVSQNANLAWTNGKKTYVLPTPASSREIYTVDIIAPVIDAEVGRRYCSGQQKSVERD